MEQPEIQPIEPKAEEKKSVLRVIIHSFFVVPFLIAVIAVLIFLVMRIITAEPNTARDYLNDIKVGGSTKRWQGAFELSKILSNPKLIPKDDRFVYEMISAFEHSQHDRDVRVRQYLALAMGRVEDPRYIPVLIKGLNDDDPGTISSCIYALGLIKEPETVAPLIVLKDHNNSQVRLQLVIALGHIGTEAVLPILREKLQDIEPNIRWDAAIALTKLRDPSGRRILLDLLDRTYLNSFPNVDQVEQILAILVAIEVAWLIGDSEIKQALEILQDNDPNYKIRGAARLALEKFK